MEGPLLCGPVIRGRSMAGRVPGLRARKRRTLHPGYAHLLRFAGFFAFAALRTAGFLAAAAARPSFLASRIAQ
jgi:hypothetical protein